MKNLLHVLLSVFALGLLFISVSTSAQNTPQRHNDFVTENPNADADISVVREFLNAYFKNDAAKVRSLVAPKYMSYGPSIIDSASVDKSIEMMQYNAKTQTNIQYDFLLHSFRAKTGPQQGDWVSAWGTYSFTEGGKSAKFPFHYQAKVVNGKLIVGFVYYDRMAVAQALGYTITPPETAKK